MGHVAAMGHVADHGWLLLKGELVTVPCWNASFMTQSVHTYADTALLVASVSYGRRDYTYYTM
jgi:hypothetical protein